MSDQPTWDEIRDVWVDSRARNNTEVEQYQAAFDRALAAHDVQVFREGFTKGRSVALAAVRAEILSIPHWYNTEDRRGGFDIQPLGPDASSEEGSFMAVMEALHVVQNRSIQEEV